MENSLRFSGDGAPHVPASIEPFPKQFSALFTPHWANSISPDLLTQGSIAFSNDHNSLADSVPHPRSRPIGGDSSIDTAPPLCTGRGDCNISHSSFASAEEDLLLDPFLEYINGILMDENMESRNWPVQQNCLDDYLNIVNGFYEILGEGSSCLPSPSLGSYSDQMASVNASFGRPEGENCWIQGVLGSDNVMAISSFQQQPKEDGHPPHSLPYNPTLQRGGGTGTEIILSGQDVAKFGPFQNGAEQHVLQMNRGLEDISVPNRRKYPWEEAVAPGGGCSGGQPIANGPTYAESSEVEDDVSFVRNEDLKAEVHAQLHEGLPLRGTEPSSGAAGRANGKRKVDEALGNPVDLRAVLVSCAKAVGVGDSKMANDILREVKRDGVSSHGSGLQRMGHYFSEALEARIRGTGSSLYSAISNNTKLPSAVLMLKGYKLVFEVCPYVKLSHYFADQHILSAAKGASRLHIVDYGIFYGFQWPCLISALAHRRGGPPFLRITGIELPTKPADLNPSKTVEEAGRRLAEYARTYNVPFQYHAIAASKWEDVDPASLHITQGEVLVFNSFNRLRHLLDESVVAPSPRDKLLRRMRSLNPDLLLMAEINAAHSSPFFAARFREALHYYSSKFDVLHTTLSSDSPERLLIERELMGRAILNVVACEGVERVERPETYKQWQVRIQKAGFQQLPLIPTVLSTSQAVLNNFYHKDFSVHHDSNTWMLLGWKGRSMQAVSAWKPAST